MPRDISPERIAALAGDAGFSLSGDDAARIARAATPMLTRFAAGGIAMPLETEPSTFAAVQHKDAVR
jgi:hypothetical protein